MFKTQGSWCAIIAQAILTVASLGWLALPSISGGLLLIPVMPSSPPAGAATLALSHGAKLVAARASHGSILVTGDAKGLIWAAITHGILPLPADVRGCSSSAGAVPGR